jgi:hypothetical protein
MGNCFLPGLKRLPTHFQPLRKNSGAPLGWPPNCALGVELDE